MKGVEVGFKAERVIRGGATVATFIGGIEGQKGYAPVDVRGYDLILINVGTNDVAQGRSVSKIIDDLTYLVETIRILNGFAVIAMATILYRPHDDRDTYGVISAVNRLILSFSTKLHNCFCLRSVNLFRAGPVNLRTDLYSQGGVHLSTRGKEVLGHYLSSQLSNGNIAVLLRRYPGLPY